MAEVFVALGSNMGNREENIKKALDEISKKNGVIKKSRFYKTKPQEGVSGEWFLNGVILIKTKMKPLQLLRFLQSIEKKLGRPNSHKKNTARTIDLDILFYDKTIIKKKSLIIPHPRLAQRDFVLKGLIQINPDFIHPETKKSIKEIWQELKNGNFRKKRTGKKSC